MTRLELNGKVYRLEDSRHDMDRTKSVCSGCAFNADTCMTVVKDDSCVAGPLESYGVWKEIQE